MEQSPADLSVAGLFSYPVKGCQGIALENADVLISGLENDREWMVVDTRYSPAQFVTQRECAAMATVAAELTAEAGLRLSIANGETIDVPPPIATALRKVKVWNHETVALDAGDDVADWIGRHLGRTPDQSRLVRFHPKMRRDCNRLYAADSGAHTFFADGYPVLVTSSSSLTDLNRRLRQAGGPALSMNRFRPNVVIGGLPAWDEDHVDVIRIGEVELKLVKPCVRCQVTTTDQTTGERVSDEPLGTLARFRNNVELGGVTFGWNAVVIRAGRISVGSAVTAEYRF